MDLKALAAFAVKNNNTRSGNKPLHTFTIEEAREYVKVKDGNKKPNEDGSQALTLVLGKHTLPLNAIAEGTTRVNAEAASVEGFTEAMLEAVKNGDFDAEIVAAQAKAEIQFNTPRKPRTPKAAVAEGEAPEAVDLDALSGVDEDEDEEGFEPLD